jgi:Zn-dependent oligopeptidase
MPDSLRLVDFASLTPDDIAQACQGAIDACDSAVAEIVAIPHHQRTLANTMLALESAGDRLSQASGQYAFMGYVSDNEQVRDTARNWDEKIDKYAVALSRSAKISMKP